MCFKDATNYNCEINRKLGNDVTAMNCVAPIFICRRKKNIFSNTLTCKLAASKKPDDI